MLASNGGRKLSIPGRERKEIAPGISLLHHSDCHLQCRFQVSSGMEEGYSEDGSRID